MNKQIIIVISVVGIILALGAGYYLGQNQVEKRIIGFTLLPKSPTIKEWRAGLSGVVKSITPESITVSSGDQSVSLTIPKETKFEKITIVDRKLADTVKNLSSSDIKVGATVFVSLIADLNGVVKADTITIEEIK